MRKLWLAVAMMCFVIIGGCTEIQNAYDVLTGATISPTSIYVAANAFDAVEQTATNYLKLAACSGSNGPICRNKTAVSQIVPLVRSGRVARNQLETSINGGGGAPTPASAYSVLTAATKSLQQIIAQYNIGGAQ